MSMLMLLAAMVLPAPAAPACHPAQLRLSLDGRDGDFNGMSHSGTELSIRNLGADCTLPALPTIVLRDARGRALPASRQAPIGMHPGPVMLPVHLPGGKRATTDLRWVSGPVFPQSRALHIAAITVTIGTTTLRAPLKTDIWRDGTKPANFTQTPLQIAEGMAAG